MNLLKQCIVEKYATFSGRASRKEYCFFLLFYLVLFLITLANQQNILRLVGVFFMIIMLPPYLTVVVRRLHDIDLSGWWVLLSCIPVVSLIGFILLMFIKGTTASNRFGPVPLVVT